LKAGATRILRFMPASVTTVAKFVPLFPGIYLILPHGALADDKSQYNLFNPTPPSLMREFEPDRPDLTDSAFTVDAGHIQVEADISNYSLSRPDSDKAVTDTFLFAPTEFRIGVTNNAELDVLVQPFKAVRTRSTEQTPDAWDVGTDVLEVSARFNLVGNDAFERPGAWAVGLKPFVEIPTTRNAVSEENVEGGLVIPFAIKLTQKLEAELMTEYDIIKNSERSGYHVEYFNSGSLTYRLTRVISPYIEAATILGGDEPTGPVVIVGTGVLFELSENFSIDFASNIGITGASDRVNLVVGLAKRF
jgi:hypothetical protein